jgi:hypothetical protein
MDQDFFFFNKYWLDQFLCQKLEYSQIVKFVLSV